MKFTKFTNSTFFSFLKKEYSLLFFIVATLIIHYAFRYWANKLGYYPISGNVKFLNQWLTEVVFNQTKAIIAFIGSPAFTFEDHTLYFENSYITINSSCSGLKQFLQSALLFLVFPLKSFKHKLWFIPVSVVLMHLSNLLRILLLIALIQYYPEKFDFFHDYLLRPIFYVVIFALWLYWTKVLHKR